jgi:hypothetical protein
LFYGIIALMIFIGIYNRSENFTYAFIVAILFLGTTGLFTVMVPSVGLGLASVLLVIGGAILFTRLIIALRR